MRGSHVINASRTRVSISPMVVVLTFAKMNSFKPAPKSGRITRSPRFVKMMIRIAWRISSSKTASATTPSGSTRGGNAQPMPRKAFAESVGLVFIPSANHYCRLAGGDGIGAASLDYRITRARCREVINQDKKAADGNHSTDVRLRAV